MARGEGGGPVRDTSHRRSQQYRPDTMRENAIVVHCGEGGFIYCGGTRVCIWRTTGTERKGRHTHTRAHTRAHTHRARHRERNTERETKRKKKQSERDGNQACIFIPSRERTPSRSYVITETTASYRDASAYGECERDREGKKTQTGR